MHSHTRSTCTIPQEPSPAQATPHKVLIADDSRVNRFVVEHAVRRQGMEPLLATDGAEALQIVSSHQDLSFAILDWMMPKLSGLEVCRAIRRAKRECYLYVVMVTSRERPEDLRVGLEAGADDYLVKPVHPTELQLRMAAVSRLLDLQRELRAKSAALRETRREISVLSRLLPMCMYCKSVRDADGSWHSAERYISALAGERISHGICPSCCGKEDS